MWSLTSLKNKKEFFLGSSGEVGCFYTVLQEDGAQVEMLQLEKAQKELKESLWPAGPVMTF